MMQIINFNLIIFFILINFLLVIFFSKIVNLVDIKDFSDHKRKFQKKPMPLLGGTLLLINVILFFTYKFTLNENLELNLNLSSNREYFSLICGIISFYLFGLYDDKYKLSPNYKLLISFFLVTSIILIDNNLVIHELKFTFLSNPIQLKSFSYLFTVLCIMLFMNAFNMFDGINLQSGFYTLLIFSIFIFKGVAIDLSFVFIVSLIFFLYLNFINKTYLGESGIQLLTIIISYVLIKSSSNELNIFFSDEIFLLLALPGLDMFRLFVSRIINGKHPFKPDYKHLHNLIGCYFNNFNTFLLIFLYIISSIIFYYISSNKLVYLIFYISVYLIMIFLLTKKINKK